MGDEDLNNEILNELDLPNYDSVEKALKGSEIPPQKTKSYLNKIIKGAKYRGNQLKG